MRDGILSPDNKTVSHDAQWVPAVISPNGDMYFHSGEWHPLANKVTQTQATSNSIPNNIENDSYSTENQIAKDAILKQIFSGVICLILFWYIFDSGEIISNWDAATEVDCSVLGDFQEFGWDELEDDCEDEVLGARIKVLFSIIVIICLISYILDLNKINPREEIKRIQQNKKSQANALEGYYANEEKKKRENKIEKWQKQLRHLEKRLAILQNIEKFNIKLSDKNLKLEQVKKEYNWEIYEKKTQERKKKYLVHCLFILAIGVFLSMLPIAYLSTNYQLYSESANKGQIYQLLGISTWFLVLVAVAPIFIFKKYHSVPLITTKNPVPKLIAEVEGISGIIEEKTKNLRNLDNKNEQRKKFRRLDSDGTKKIIAKMKKKLEDLDE